MEKRRWNDDLEVEERKIEDQARQRRAVAVSGICCQLVYRYCDFSPLTSMVKVLTCVGHLKDTYVVQLWSIGVYVCMFEVHSLDYRAYNLR